MEKIPASETKPAKVVAKKDSSKPAEKRIARGALKTQEVAKNTILLSSIELSDYSDHAEAAEAISHALSTYANQSPESIRISLINYLKKQLRAGAKAREEILVS